MTIIGCNDTAAEIPFDLKYGYVKFDGSEDDYKTIPVLLPPHTRKTMLVFDKGDHEGLSGLWYAAPVNMHIRPAFLLTDKLKNLNIPPVVATISQKDINNDLLVTIEAKTFCHGVYLKLPPEAKPSDNFFDLLPGECRDVLVEGITGKKISIEFVGDFIERIK